MLIFISGCSGAGKNTIIQELIKRHDNIKFLKSCTTRKKRPNENADTYIYVTKEQFDNMLKNDEMFEYEEIHQNFYGITKQSLADVVEMDKKGIHYIKDIGVLGKLNMERVMKNKVPVVSVFLEVPRAQLIKRLQERGEKDIDLRLSRMEFEMGYIDNFDEKIRNIDLEKTLTRLEKIIAKTQKKRYTEKGK